MGILGQLLIQRSQANLQRKNAIEQAQAQGLIDQMGKLNPDGTPALDEAGLSSAQDQLNKLIGIKGSSPVAQDQSRILDIFHGVVNKLHGHARDQAGQPSTGTTPPPIGAGAGAGAGTDAGSTPSPTPTIPPMPSSTDLASGNAPVPQVSSQGVPPMPPPTPPPSFGQVIQQGAMSESKPLIAAQGARDIATKAKADSDATIAANTAKLDAAGIEKGTPQYQFGMMSGNPLPISSMALNKPMLDMDTHEPFTNRGIGPNGGFLDDKGAEHMNARQSYAADVSGVKKLQSPAGGGAPIGVQIGNQSWAAGDSNMPPEAKDYLDKGVKEYNSHQLTLTERGLAIARARAQAYAAMQPMEVMNSKTGNVALVTKDKIAANPGQYVSGTQAQQVATRAAMFSDIHRDSDQLSNSIENLPEDAFTADQRAKLAVVMRSTDPQSALSAFITSTAANGMTQPEIDYVTSIASMAESAMALRQAGGLSGQSSDMLRGAVGAMIPSSGTPSKAYAKLQMDKFNKEVSTLEQGRLGIANFAPRIAPMPAPGAGKPAASTSPAARPKTADDYLKGLQNASPGQ